jgi:hypothetical protein
LEKQGDDDNLGDRITVGPDYAEKIFGFDPFLFGNVIAV